MIIPNELSWKVREALSDIPTHNHLVDAYHDAVAYRFAPPWGLMWKIPAIAVPSKVRRLVDAATVVTEMRRRISEARTAIDEFREVLDQEEQRMVVHVPDRPYAHLHPSVVVERQVVPTGYAPGWIYQYNPYALVTTLLNEYERFIDKTMHSRLVPFTKVSRICEEAKRFNDSVQLLS